MTIEQQQELSVLLLANEAGKFAVPVGTIEPLAQLALERMQMRRWIVLMDVTPIAHGEPKVVYRVFRASTEALAFRDQHREVAK